MTRLITFQQGRGSPKAKKGNKYLLEKFYKASSIKSHSDLLKASDEDLEESIMIYLEFLKDRVEQGLLKSNTVPNYMGAIKKMLIINGRENSVRWNRLQMLYPNKTALSGYRPWSKADIAEMLKFAKTLRSKALILFLASNGGRKGIFDAKLGHELLLKHLVPMEYYNGDKMYAVLLYAEDGLTVEEMEERESGNAVQGAEYWSFLTPEATKALDQYLDWCKRQGDPLDKDTPIFCALKGRTKTHTPTAPLSAESVYAIVDRIVKSAEIKRIKKGRRYNTQLVHGFRKFTNGALKMTDGMNYSIAEKILAHKVHLDTMYLKPTREQCFKEFCKGVPELTIDESLKKSMQLEKVEVENETLKVTNAENRLIKMDLVDMKQTIADMKTDKNSRGNNMFDELMKDPAMKQKLVALLMQHTIVAE